MNTPLDYRIYAISFLFFCSAIAEKTLNISENESQFIQTYKQKICQLENTCDIVNQAPQPFQDLRTRNCMCDDKCHDYNDCCPDATSQKVNSENASFPLISCVQSAFDGGVYMVKSCSDTWNDSSIAEQCLAKNSITLSYDILLKLPVTNSEKGITYSNVFCAICNNQTKYEFWNVGLTYELLSSNVNIFNSSSLNTSQYTVDRTVSDADIVANLTFNETGEMFWSSRVNESLYKCDLQAKAPSSITSLRYCIPNVVKICMNGTLCDGFASYVYFEDKVFHNSNCARCNNKTGIFKGCVENRRSRNELIEILIVDPAIPKVPHCNELPASSAAHDSFCKSKDEVAPTEECYVLKKKGKKLCFVNKYFYRSQNHYYYVDNTTIFLHEYDAEFPESDWFAFDDDKLFVCGQEIPKTRFQRIMHRINDITTEILIKISIICIILHLVAFSQLSEFQNLSGKNLASFCVALLLAFILFDVGPWLPSCEIVAIVEHYCFLSCFTWMLIISYDVWLSLYRATSQFRTSGGKHQMKFLIYSILAWILPLFIVGPAIYAEFAPSSVVSCELKPAYGKFDQCFLAQQKPLFYFFFIPASIIFVINICFFAHTAYMIYLSQRKTVNPNTRHDFRLYSRLGLLMGLTWTLGSLVTITNNVLIELLFTLFNMSQGIFIFFGFTFKRKTAKGLLQRHRDNKFLSSTFSTFVSGAEMATTVSENTTTPRQTRMEVL